MMRTKKYLRRRGQHHHQPRRHRALDHTLFDAPEHHQPPVNSNIEGASRDDYEEFTNNPQEPHFASPQPQANNPNQPSQPQPPLITESADWDTRAKILLCETIVVTVIVGSILCCCLRKQYRKLAERQRVFITREQLQELTTIRISPEASSNSPVVRTGALGGHVGRTRVDSNLSGMISVGRDGRLRVDSNLSGMLSAAAGAGAQLESDPTTSGANSIVVENTAANTASTAASNSRNRSILQRISHTLSYPLRMLESGINSWATENQDEIFLRQFIERLDAEREAARENPDDRERRVKEAFVKECMIWELDEENFIPPEELLAGFAAATTGESPAIKCIDEDDQDTDDSDPDDNIQVNFDYGQSSLDQGGQCEEQDVGEGEANVDQRSDSKENKFEEGKVDMGGHQNDEKETISRPAPILTESVSALANNQPDLVGSPSEQNRPRTASAPSVLAEDTFDSDSAPGYLYLNACGNNNRRRANTGGSIVTSDLSAATANQSLRLSPAESMESFGAASSASSSQESVKITNECAICLCEYERGDTVVTSCNPECSHAFHQECIVEWLVKMQEGTPCPCCRRTFVEIDEFNPQSVSGNNAQTTTTATVASNNNNAAADQAEREERRRHRIEQGIQRGSRAFNTSAISMRSSSSVGTSRTPEEAERRRQERIERYELGLRRGNRAFNTSVIHF